MKDVDRSNVAGIRKALGDLGAVVAEVDPQLRYVWIDNLGGKLGSFDRLDDHPRWDYDSGLNQIYEGVFVTVITNLLVLRFSAAP